jgi:competence protein ComEC
MMRAATPEQRALRPLWMLGTGVVVSAVVASLTPVSPPPPVCWLLLAFGCAAVISALRWRRAWALWLVAGLALSGGRGGQVQRHRLELERQLAEPSEIALRVRATVNEGWAAARWGWRTRASVHEAHLQGRRWALPRSCRIEVRGSVRPGELPIPGAVVEALMSVRGTARNPLLVASSPQLVEVVRPARGLPELRHRLAGALLAAAGTDVQRLRAAELAAALTLGRRDLLPDERREGWRHSGLAHLLAVSGLHVGLVAGMVWLAALLVGARPRAARIAVLVSLPAYALLAGASPSATRAAVMGMIYFGALLLGRALVPMAAVILTAVILLLARPDLAVSAGFQLTVLITAALVRWVPEVVEKAPGPRWLSGAISVPLVAQVAAAPIVAWHFRTAIPGAVAANLLVPPLLAPTMVAALAAAALAPLWPAASGWCLEAVALLERLLWYSGTAGRAVELVLPALPVVAAAALAVAGWLALRPGPSARLGVAGWVLVGILTTGWWWLRPRPDGPRVELLPVADGLSVMVAAATSSTLVDGGRWPDEAAQLLADRGVRRLVAVAASHTDEDHIGGLVGVTRSLSVETLVVPVWMLSDPLTVPLLRAARASGARIVPVARGSAVTLDGGRIEVIWPPAVDPPEVENERSLVARVRQSSGVVLVTSDIGRSTEVRLARIGSLSSQVMIAPHHGSRGSTSSALLAAADPRVVLVPAGPRNIHNHPHAEVLQRIDARGIPFRYPARDGWCGARFADGEWVAYP